MTAELAELLVADAEAWRAWLVDNHLASPGVWLVLSKQGGKVTGLDYAAALDEALCFGWIDGQAARRDEGSTRRRFTRRRSKSAWSRRNVEHVARLAGVGKMTPAGQAAVDAAKADGRWGAAYPGPAAAEVPADWADALADDAGAKAMWDILTSQNRYAITYRIAAAKRPETRAKRLAEFLAMLARGETIHPQNQRLE